MNWHLLIPVGSYVVTSVLKILFPKNQKIKQLAPIIGTVAGVLGGIAGQQYQTGELDPSMTGIDAFLGMSASGMHEHGEMFKRSRGRKNGPEDVAEPG